MRAIASSRAAPSSTTRRAVAIATAVLVVGMSGVAGAADHGSGGPGDPDPGDYPPDSDAGITPELFSSQQGGGNLRCTDVDPTYTGSAHFEMGEEEATVDPAAVQLTSEDDDDHEHPEPPGDLEFDVTDKVVSWTADFPITAVIVKGGNRSYIYEYAPTETSDGGLVTPVNNGGNPADVSSLRFCWEGDPPAVDLTALCEQAAADAGVTVTWTQGPVEIRGGVVDQSTVPAGFGVTFDTTADEVGFTAPGPVVAVVTEASEPVAHLIEPPATSGTVPLASNPGDGDVVLCGVMQTVEPVELSCDGVDDVTEVGPVAIMDGAAVGPLPAGIMSVMPNTVDVAFAADVPVAAVVVAASDPVMFAFDPTVTSGEVDVALDGEDAEMLFCVRTVADDPDDPDDDTPVTTQSDDTTTTSDDTTADAASAGDPTTIPTGGGPAGRTPLALVAFVIIALSGSTGLLLWSRGG